jgi:glutathione S-transferase
MNAVISAKALPEIVVHQFPAIDGVQVGPFCLKLTTWLQIAGLPFTASANLRSDRAPKGKMPYATIDGELVADSQIIIDRLKAIADPDAWLSAEQKAQAVAVQRMVEDHLYFILVCMRWVEPTAFASMKEQYFAKMPSLLRKVIPALIRRGVVRNMRGHGMSRHSNAELLAMAEADFSSLSTLLGDKPFFMGDKPCSLDAIVYGQLVTISCFKWQSPFKDLCDQKPNLMAFIQRMQNDYGLCG